MRSMLAAALVLFCAVMAHAQDEDRDRKLDLYAQFSGFKADSLTRTAAHNTELAKGVDLGTAWYPVRNVALVGDIGYHTISDSSSQFSVLTIMAGPHFSSGEHYRMSCYWQLLFGALAGRQTGASAPATIWRPAGALGGGFEVRLTERLVLRPIYVDLMLVGVPKNSVGAGRIGTGIVYRFK
jgi:hypothetical protein